MLCFRRALDLGGKAARVPNCTQRKGSDTVLYRVLLRGWIEVEADDPVEAESKARTLLASQEDIVIEDLEAWEADAFIEGRSDMGR